MGIEIAPSQEKHKLKENKSMYHERSDELGQNKIEVSFINLFQNSAFPTARGMISHDRYDHFRMSGLFAEKSSIKTRPIQSIRRFIP